MKLDRKEILKALESISIAGEGKNMVESGAVQNVVVFGDEVVVDLVISSPAMHIKKRAEEDVKKLIQEQFPAATVVKINTKVEAPAATASQAIKVKPFPASAILLRWLPEKAA